MNPNTTPETPPRALGLGAAARYLSVSKSTVRRLVRRGLISPSRLTKRPLFDRADLDRLLEQSKS